MGVVFEVAVKADTLAGTYRPIIAEMSSPDPIDHRSTVLSSLTEVFDLVPTATSYLICRKVAGQPRATQFTFITFAVCANSLQSSLPVLEPHFIVENSNPSGLELPYPLTMTILLDHTSTNIPVHVALKVPDLDPSHSLLRLSVPSTTS